MSLFRPVCLNVNGSVLNAIVRSRVFLDEFKKYIVRSVNVVVTIVCSSSVFLLINLGYKSMHHITINRLKMS